MEDIRFTDDEAGLERIRDKGSGGRRILLGYRTTYRPDKPLTAEISRRYTSERRNRLKTGSD
jgi:hypothetical protein